jgi:site-specific DNA recombinase
MTRSSRGSSSTGADAAKVTPLGNATSQTPRARVQKQRRAVAYIRESTEEQGRGYSPDGQRQAIGRYAEDHGLDLVDEYLDFETGRVADKRPGFQRLIEDAMARRFEVVLVFHTSRFARNTLEAKRYKKLLRSELGIAVISVTQPIGTDVDDPAAFLAESVHEIFDEYYSVSLSFWTKMGLREKARQGLLTGSLPWGYVKGPDGVAVPDQARAPILQQLFELYADGQHSNRTLAVWLNERGHRTTRGALFCADTVRDMLGNAAYCGYVSGHRDKTKAIRGQHAPLIDEELFDRVQDLRRQRTTTSNPGRPSSRYLLRSLARCERCDGRMQGTAVGRRGAPRYYCATRRKQHACDQPLAPADRIEEQIVEFIADFRPGQTIRDEILRRLAAPATVDTAEVVRRRAALDERRRRVRDLYELGDLDRDEYLARRQAIDTELDSLAPGLAPDIDAARGVLDDFSLSGGRSPTPNRAASCYSTSLSASGSTTSGSSPCAPSPPSAFFVPEAAVGKERERRDSNPRPPA